MNRPEEARELMAGSHMNCAQAVLSVFAEELGMDRLTVLKIATGFGAGMGRTGGICGAVSGAYMVLGLKPYPDISSPAERKEKVYSLVQEFNKRFISLHNSTSCTQLLGYDLSKPDGRAAARENKPFSKTCPELVASAVKILEEME
jgi:C_GCAxxG_C_C family probable redox protein